MAGDHLGRIASEYFATVQLATKAPPGHASDAAGLRARLVSQLEAISQHPYTRSLDAQEVESARFALVAWADEMLLRSEWAARDAWAAELLQTQLFGTNRGGDEFYERLERLRPDQNAAREIFFLCFAFGFEGALVGQDAQRRALMQHHYDILRASGAALDAMQMGRLAPLAYRVEVDLEPPSSGGVPRLLLRWAGVAALTFAALWGVLAFFASRVPQPPGS